MEINSTKQEIWLGKAVPRYTSYPTAPHFAAAFPQSTYRGWLEKAGAMESFSLYLHIPFCEKMCWFCGCHTSVTRHYEPVSRYVDFLIQELKIISASRAARRKVTSVHFGGGSPTILTEQDFARIMDAIREFFEVAEGAEIAVEIDPRTLTKGKAEAYAANGVNRTSIGVQDLNPAVQEVINRQQPFEIVAESVEWLNYAGINAVNIDLVYGLPLQTIASIEHTLSKVLSLNPSRFALFSYAHVPWMKKHQRLISEETLPDNFQKLEMFAYATETLNKSGFESIGIDHFAKADDSLFAAMKERKMHRNFQGYTTDSSSFLIGLGVSSISQTAYGYCQNTTNSHTYREQISNGRLPVEKGIETNIDDVARKAVIDSLMCYFDVDLNVVTEKFSLPANYFDAEISLMQPYINAGMINVQNNVVTFDFEFPMAVRNIASVFDTYLNSSERRYSKVA